MFEAKLADGSILKRIVEAIKDVVNDVNIDVSPSGKLPNSDLFKNAAHKCAITLVETLKMMSRDCAQL